MLIIHMPDERCQGTILGCNADRNEDKKNSRSLKLISIFLMRDYISAIGKLEHYNISYWKDEPDCHLTDWGRLLHSSVQNLSSGYFFLLHRVPARVCPD